MDFGKWYVGRDFFFKLGMLLMFPLFFSLEHLLDFDFGFWIIDFGKW
jgi:hypothetical protein